MIDLFITVDVRPEYNRTLEFGFYSQCDLIPVFGIYSSNIESFGKDAMFHYKINIVTPYKKTTKAQALDYFLYNLSARQTIFNKDGSSCLISKGCLAHFESDKLVFDFILTVRKESLLKKGFNPRKVKEQDLVLLINKDSETYIKSCKLASAEYLESLKHPSLDVIYTDNIEKYVFRKSDVPFDTPETVEEEENYLVTLDSHIYSHR